MEFDIAWKIIVVLVTDIVDALRIVDARDYLDCTINCKSEQISRVHGPSLAEPDVASVASVAYHSSVVAVKESSGSVPLELEIRTCDCSNQRSLGRGGGDDVIVRRGHS